MFQTTRLGWTTLLLAASTAMVHAQTSATTGSVTAFVHDSHGKAVAGTIATLSNAQISKTATVGEDGLIRFGLLTPGTYKLQLVKAGYQTIALPIRINTNETTSVRPKMVQESSQVVDVIASVAPSVDVTSTTTGTTTGSELLSTLPVGRSLFSAASMAPGVVTGESGGMVISGASGIENAYVTDGLATANVRDGGAGKQLDPAFVDQIEIQTGGFKPEFSAMGGVVNVVSKSGTNKFEGYLALTTNLPGIEAKPFPGFVLPVGDNGAMTQTNKGKQVRSSSLRETVFTFSGPIVADKVFFFVGATGYTQNLPSDARVNQNYEGLTLLNSEQTTKNLNAYAKINTYLTTNQQLTLAVQKATYSKGQTDWYPDYGTANRGWTNESKDLTWTLNYDWTINSNTFLTMKYGRTTNSQPYVNTDSSKMLVIDYARPYYKEGIKARSYQLGGGNYGDLVNDTNTSQFRVDLSWFLGNHNLKVGYQASENSFKEVSGYPGNPSVYTPYGTNGLPMPLPAAPLVRIYYPGYGQASSSTGDVISLLWYGQNAEVKSKYNAIYVQDTWEATQGLRLAYGLRADGQETLDANGKTFFDFKNPLKHLQPRLGITWDALGDGRTKVFGNIAKYYEQVPLVPTMRQGGREYYLRNNYNAKTGKALYDQKTGAWSIPAGATPDKVTDFAASFAAPPQVDGLKLPSRMEYGMGIQHSFSGADGGIGKTLDGWTASLNFRYRTILDVMEDTVITDRDGGFSNLHADRADHSPFGYAIMWNPTPGKVTWTDKSGSKITADSTPYPKASNISRTLEFALSKTTDRYTINFNYTWQNVKGNYDGLGSTTGQNEANITASWDFWPYVGFGTIPFERHHSFKIQGTYSWMLFTDQRLTLGAQGSLISGRPRTIWTNGEMDGVVDTDYGDYGDAVPYHFQYGTGGTQPWYRNLDLSVNYDIPLTKRVKLSPKFEIFNVFNKRAITSYDDYMHSGGSLNPYYNMPNGLRTGRNYRFTFGVRF